MAQQKHPRISFDHTNGEETARNLLLQRWLSNEMDGLVSESMERTDTQYVLHVACGTGDGLFDLARAHPHIQFVSIERDEGSIRAAEHLARSEGVQNITLLAHDLTHFDPHLFPRASFDVINVAFLATQSRVSTYQRYTVCDRCIGRDECASSLCAISIGIQPSDQAIPASYGCHRRASL